jgi:hypothetical protein
MSSVFHSDRDWFRDEYEMPEGVHNLVRDNSSHRNLVMFGAIIKSEQQNTRIIKVLLTQLNYFEL